MALADSRLAAGLQIVTDLHIERSDRAATRVGREVLKVWRELLNGIRPGRGQIDNFQRAIKKIQELPGRVEKATTKELRGMSSWAYERTYQAFVDHLDPAYWGFLVEPTLTEAIRIPKGPEGEAARAIFRPLPLERANELIQTETEGVSYQQRILNLSRRTLDPEAVAAQIGIGISAGKGPREIAREIRPLIGGYKAGAERIARTESLRVANMTRQESFKQFDRVMAGQRLIETLDERTRPHHQARHGTIFVKDEFLGAFPGSKPLDQAPTLPDEPNCRGTYTMVLKPRDGLLDVIEPRHPIASSIDGPVKDPGTYSKWFDKQNETRKARIAKRGRWRVTKEKLGRQPKWKELINPEDGRLIRMKRLAGETKSEILDRSRAVQGQIDAIQSANRAALATPAGMLPIPKPAKPPKVEPVKPPEFSDNPENAIRTAQREMEAAGIDLNGDPSKVRAQFLQKIRDLNGNSPELKGKRLKLIKQWKKAVKKAKLRGSVSMLEDLAAAIDDRLLTDEVMSVKYSVKRSGRGFADHLANEVAVVEFTETRALAHEFGHHLEYRDTRLENRSLRWIQDRWKNAGHQFKPLLGGGEAFIGGFYEDYVGRVYPRDFTRGGQILTEITAMGLDAVFDLARWKAAVARDPDHLRMLWAILRGY